MGVHSNLGKAKCSLQSLIPTFNKSVEPIAVPLNIESAKKENIQQGRVIFRGILERSAAVVSSSSVGGGMSSGSNVISSIDDSGSSKGNDLKGIDDNKSNNITTTDDKIVKDEVTNSSNKNVNAIEALAAKSYYLFISKIEGMTN